MPKSVDRKIACLLGTCYVRFLKSGYAVKPGPAGCLIWLARRHQNWNICVQARRRGGPSASRKYSAICLDPPPVELAEPITLRDKLACVWKQLLAAPSQISVAVDLRSMTK